MVMHSICSISACHSLHTSNPSPHPSASPAPRTTRTQHCSRSFSESAARGWASGELGSPAGEADTHEFWQLGNQEYFSVWTKFYLNTAIVVPFFSPLRCHYIPFCFDFKCCCCNCWEEFLVLVLKFCWCTSHNRPFMCETSEDTTFVLQFRY